MLQTIGGDGAGLLVDPWGATTPPPLVLQHGCWHHTCSTWSYQVHVGLFFHWCHTSTSHILAGTQIWTWQRYKLLHSRSVWRNWKLKLKRFNEKGTRSELSTWRIMFKVMDKTKTQIMFPVKVRVTSASVNSHPWSLHMLEEMSESSQSEVENSGTDVDIEVDSPLFWTGC